MIKDRYEVICRQADPPLTITVQPDRRLKRSARWSCEGANQILLRVPIHTSNQQIQRIIDDLSIQMTKKREKASRLTDDDLQRRASEINATCFNSAITWEAIRWVNNMDHRLGSCTNGGMTDGHIRISSRIKDWPDYVIDYIIAHELAHRRYANHSKAFWKYLSTGYPDAEKARGFIEGVAFAQGLSLEEDIDSGL